MKMIFEFTKKEIEVIEDFYKSQETLFETLGISMKMKMSDQIKILLGMEVTKETFGVMTTIITKKKITVKINIDEETYIDILKHYTDFMSEINVPIISFVSTMKYIIGKYKNGLKI